jgi:hypothetical protein
MYKLMVVATLAAVVAAPGVAMAQYANPYHWSAPYYQSPGAPAHHDRHHRGTRDSAMCADLRASCTHKEELGERGQGNCARYRQLCH